MFPVCFSCFFFVLCSLVCFFVFLHFCIVHKQNKHMRLNRTVNIKNASKRMSNYASCLCILMELIGFEKSNNGEKITLPDQVEIDTLIVFKNFLQDSNDNFDNVSSYKMETDKQSSWACNRCTYYNSIDANTCQMCDLPRDVCETTKKKQIIFCQLYVVFVTCFV